MVRLRSVVTIVLLLVVSPGSFFDLGFLHYNLFSKVFLRSIFVPLGNRSGGESFGYWDWNDWGRSRLERLDFTFVSYVGNVTSDVISTVTKSTEMRPKVS